MACLIEVNHHFLRRRQIRHATYALTVRQESAPRLGDQILEALDRLLQALSLGPKEFADLMRLDPDRIPKLLGRLEDGVPEALAILRCGSVGLGRLFLPCVRLSPKSLKALDGGPVSRFGSLLRPASAGPAEGWAVLNPFLDRVFGLSAVRHDGNPCLGL